MKKKLFALLVMSVFVVGVGSAAAVEQITAQEAYDMVNSGQATLIDVRTLEECYWVGSPALVPGGDPIAVVIPWQIITIDNSGTVTKEENPDFIIFAACLRDAMPAFARKTCKRIFVMFAWFVIFVNFVKIPRKTRC